MGSVGVMSDSPPMIPGSFQCGQDNSRYPGPETGQCCSLLAQFLHPKPSVRRPAGHPSAGAIRAVPTPHQAHHAQGGYFR